MTATKHDTAKPRPSLLPPAIEHVLAVMEFGAQKYGEHNWRSGMQHSRAFNAALRHLWAWWRGEDNDPESNLPHLAHAAVNCLFIMDWKRMGVGQDDRPLTTDRPPL